MPAGQYIEKKTVVDTMEIITRAGDIFKGINSLQVGVRSQGRRQYLFARVITGAHHSHVAVAPGLFGDPLDNVIDVFRRFTHV